jgi:hypothetical protein
VGGWAGGWEQRQSTHTKTAHQAQGAHAQARAGRMRGPPARAQQPQQPHVGRVQGIAGARLRSMKLPHVCSSSTERSLPRATCTHNAKMVDVKSTFIKLLNLPWRAVFDHLWAVNYKNRQRLKQFSWGERRLDRI